MKQNSAARQTQLDTVIQDAAFPTTLVDQQELSCSWLPDTTLVSINELGHTMGKRTIAEFVESREIMEKLREIGVDYVQGYGVGRRPEPLV